MSTVEACQCYLAGLGIVLIPLGDDGKPPERVYPPTVRGLRVFPMPNTTAAIHLYAFDEHLDQWELQR